MEKSTGLSSRRFFFWCAKTTNLHIELYLYCIHSCFFHRAPRASGGVKPFIKFITEQFTLCFFWKEIFLSPVKKHSNSTNVFLSHRGLNKQGYKCRRECFIDPPLCFLLSACWNSSGWNILFVPPECNAAIHKRCIEKIIGKCTGSAANSRDTMVSKVNVLASVTSGMF